MKVTDIRIIPFDAGMPGKKTRAYADIEIDSVLCIRGFRIIESRSGGVFVSAPAIRTKSGEFKDIVIIKEKGFAAELRKMILDAYKNLGDDSGDDYESTNDKGRML